MTRVPLAVIGAGPAGLSAAIEAARAGVAPVVFERQVRPGGQIYRQPLPPAEVATGPRAAPEVADGQDLLAAARGAGVEFRFGSTVWGIFDGRTLAVARPDGGSEEVRADALILATGAYERPVPFPGWTLPGVMGAGGVKALLRGQGVVPGRRILLAGTGPLLLATAAALAQAGVEVLAVVEANRMRGVWRHLRALWGEMDLLRQATVAVRALRRAGVPILRGHLVLEALGDSQVREVRIAEVDGGWRVAPGSEHRFRPDVLAVHFGFVPHTDLARLAGCACAFRPAVGGWVPEHDARMATSAPGVFVAGDGAGVAGVTVAREQGRLAGIWAAASLGRLPATAAEERARPIEARLERLGRVRAALDEIFAVREGADLVTDATLVCRCEELTWGEARVAIAEGATTLNLLKSATRAGMGLCQGRMCGPALALLAGRIRGTSPEQAGQFTPRAPVEPVLLTAMREA